MDPDQETLVPEYRKTKNAGVYVRHQARCPAASGGDGARCRCRPSYRGRRWDSGKQEMVWSPTFGDRAEVLSWLAAMLKGQEAVDEAAAAGPTFRELADDWLDGVHTGAVGRRRGKKPARARKATSHRHRPCFATWSGGARSTTAQGGLVDLQAVMAHADDPVFGRLVEQAGGWWRWPEDADGVVFRPGSPAELRASSRT
jgi:hypothetical protein